MITQYNVEKTIKNKYLLNEFVLGTEEEKLSSDIEGIFFLFKFTPNKAVRQLRHRGIL